MESLKGDKGDWQVVRVSKGATVFLGGEKFLDATAT